MDKGRAVANSVQLEIEEMLKDSSLWDNPFNIYYSSDLDEETNPTFPYVFILGPNYILPTRLPVVVVESFMQPKTYQLGSTSWMCEPNVHVIASTVGQLSELTTAIMGNIMTVRIRDFDDNPEGATVLQTASLEPQGEEGVLWVARYIVPEEWQMEGTVEERMMLTCRFPFL